MEKSNGKKLPTVEFGIDLAYTYIEGVIRVDGKLYEGETLDCNHQYVDLDVAVDSISRMVRNLENKIGVYTLDWLVICYPYTADPAYLYRLGQKLKSLYGAVRFMNRGVAGALSCTAWTKGLLGRKFLQVCPGERGDDVALLEWEDDVLDFCALGNAEWLPGGNLAYEKFCKGENVTAFAVSGKVGQLKRSTLEAVNQFLTRNSSVVMVENTKSPAAGAALYAGMLLGQIKLQLIIDVVEFSVGVRTRSDEFATIVEEQDTRPCMKEKTIAPEERLGEELEVRIGGIHQGFRSVNVPVPEDAAVHVKVEAANELGGGVFLEVVSDKPGSVPIRMNLLEPEIVDAVIASAGSSDVPGQLPEGIEALLELLDDLGRSVAYMVERGNSGDAAGLRMIEEKALRMLRDTYVVTPITAVGQPFSPLFHSAVEHIVDPTLPENYVIYERKRGYMRGDKVLRYSEVVVAN